MPPIQAGIRPTKSIPVSEVVTSSLTLPLAKLASGHFTARIALGSIGNS